MVLLLEIIKTLLTTDLEIYFGGGVRVKEKQTKIFFKITFLKLSLPRHSITFHSFVYKL
jgi:hypothetical protein